MSSDLLDDDCAKRDGEFEQRLRALLRGSAEALPGAVRSRLTQARYAALEVHAAPLRHRWQRWVPAGAMAAAVLALLVVFVPHGRPTLVGTGPSGAIEDLDLLSSDMPLTADQADQAVDYEFYEWAVDVARGTGSPTESGAPAAAVNGT